MNLLLFTKVGQPTRTLLEELCLSEIRIKLCNQPLDTKTPPLDKATSFPTMPSSVSSAFSSRAMMSNLKISNSSEEAQQGFCPQSYKATLRLLLGRFSEAFFLRFLFVSPNGIVPNGLCVFKYNLGKKGGFLLPTGSLFFGRFFVDRQHRVFAKRDLSLMRCHWSQTKTDKHQH